MIKNWMVYNSLTGERNFYEFESEAEEEFNEVLEHLEDQLNFEDEVFLLEVKTAAKLEIQKSIVNR